MSDIVVEVESGRLRGAREGGVLVFRNIPYGHAGRFAPPEPPAAWSSVRDAVTRGPICPQDPSRLESVTGPMPGHPRQSEDCLIATVTTPAVEGRRPVIAWLHGGAYVSGGGELAWYDAHALAAEGDVVVVSITYRLGVFGYLWREAPQERNLGLADQRAALAWITRNIERFGGDPGNVTVCGQSAGGHAIAALLAGAQGRPLFRRAILQSAPLAVWPTDEGARAFAHDLDQVLGEDPRLAATDSLLAAQRTVIAARREGLPVGPVVDGGAISREGVDVLVGFTADDASPFVSIGVAPDPSWLTDPEPGGAVHRLTRAVFAGSALDFAARAAGPAATFAYRLDWRPEASPFGACHCLDAALLFGDEEAWRAAPMLGAAPWPQVHALGRRLRAAWSAFAHTGDPTSDVGGSWTPFRAGAEATINALNP
jgi:para-nitrobenzyl esterase